LTDFAKLGTARFVRRWSAFSLVLALSFASVSATADVVVPPQADPPAAPAPADPATGQGSRGTLVHKPVLAALVGLLFLVMGGLAANDRNKRPNSRRA
jgi:hypothetical protein